MGRGRGRSHSRVGAMPQPSPRAQAQAAKPAVVFAISARTQKKLDSIDKKQNFFQIHQLKI